MGCGPSLLVDEAPSAEPAATAAPASAAAPAAPPPPAAAARPSHSPALQHDAQQQVHAPPHCAKKALVAPHFTSLQLEPAARATPAPGRETRAAARPHARLRQALLPHAQAELHAALAHALQASHGRNLASHSDTA